MTHWREQFLSTNRLPDFISWMMKHLGGDGWAPDMCMPNVRLQVLFMISAKKNKIRFDFTTTCIRNFLSLYFKLKIFYCSSHTL